MIKQQKMSGYRRLNPDRPHRNFTILLCLSFIFLFAAEPLAAQESNGAKIYLPTVMQQSSGINTSTEASNQGATLQDTTTVYGTLYTEVSGYAQLLQSNANGANKNEGGITTLLVEDGGAGLWQYAQQEVTLTGQWRQEGDTNIFVAKSGVVSEEIATNMDLAEAQLAASSTQNVEPDLSSAAAGGANRKGEWSKKIDLPLIPVSAANLPNGKLLLWAAHEPDTYKKSLDKTVTSIFNPTGNSHTDLIVTETSHNMFCSGTTNLTDGRVLVNGGSTNKETSIYNGATGSWMSGTRMNIGRGYNANVMLPSGSVMTIGGSWSGGKRENKSAEVWNSENGWSTLSGLPVAPIIDGATDPMAEGIYRTDNHAWLWIAGNGKVFHAGPSAKMHWLDTSDHGSYQSAGARGNDGYTMGGTTVMYAKGKLLKIGGSTSYSKGTSANARAYTININSNPPKVSQVQNMNYERTYHSSVVLPTGEVLAVGGSSIAKVFNDRFAIKVAEIWSPKTEKWRTVARMKVARTYHSTAILMPNGKVFVGGGGLCGDCRGNHSNAEIYSPPYLFNDDGSKANRPQIITAPKDASYHIDIAVKTNEKINSFALIRLSSATHGTNNDQRRVELKFNHVGNNSYNLSIPSNKGNVPPGYYMLFAMDTSGTPSVAHTIQIGQKKASNPIPVPPTTVAPTPTPSTSSPSGASFKLVAKHSGKCVDVAGIGASTDSGNIHQWTCFNTNSQRWQIVKADGGFMLKNVATGKCLDISRSVNDKGGNVHQWTCMGNPNQILNWKGNALQFKHSGKCLDVSKISSKDGANIYQWTCLGSNNQFFTMR